jgi:hypothetical protein
MVFGSALSFGTKWIISKSNFCPAAPDIRTYTVCAAGHIVVIRVFVCWGLICGLAALWLFLFCAQSNEMISIDLIQAINDRPIASLFAFSDCTLSIVG